MTKYQLTENGILDRETGASIPAVQGNRHYREYLEWVTEGNVPIPVQPSDSHYLDNDQWVIDKAMVINTVKAQASEAITTQYPEWKQLNLQSDSTYAKHTISVLLGITVDEVMQRAVSLIGLADDVDTLKNLDNSIDATVIATVTSDLTIPVEYSDSINKYFTAIVKSIIAYRLVRLVRDWSNAKELEIAEAVDVESVVLTDMPEL